MAKGIRSVWKDSDSPESLGNKVIKDGVEIADIPNGVQEYKDPDVVVNRQYKYVIQSYTATSQSTDEVLGDNLNYYTIVEVTPPTGITPIMANFRVENDTPDRVYFSTPLGYPDGLNTDGFEISSKTIGSVTKVSDSSGYFTVDEPFNFWQQSYTIRLGEVHDTGHSQPGLIYNFSMESIYNLIDEPTASTNNYMSATGSGARDGSSESNAWAPSDIVGGGVSPGTTVWMKAGTYDNLVNGYILRVVDSGTVDNPIKFIGYKNTIGDMNIQFIDDFVYDNYAQARNYFDPTEYPVIEGIGSAAIGLPDDNDDSTGLSTPGKYLIFKNFGITKVYLGVANMNDFQHYENIINGNTEMLRGHGFSFPWESEHINVRKCVIHDWDYTCLLLTGEHHMADDCRCYGGAQNPEPDYSISMNDASYSTIRDCYTEEVVHNGIGHGYGLKCSNQALAAIPPRESLYNLIVDNDMVMQGGNYHENLYLRWKTAKYNVAKRNTGKYCHSLARPGNGGSYNLWEQNKVDYCEVFIGYSGNGESDPWPIVSDKVYQSQHNVYRNNIATNISNAVIQATTKGDLTIPNNIIMCVNNEQVYNNTIDNVIDHFMYTDLKSDNGQIGWSYNFDGLEFKNNIFVVRDGNNSSFGSGPDSTSSNGQSWDYNNWVNRPSGWVTADSNILEVDPQFIDEANYIPQATMNCPLLNGVEYDNKQAERSDPTTIGAVKRNTEV